MNILSAFVFIGADHLLLPSFQTNGSRVVIACDVNFTDVFVFFQLDG